MAPRTPNSEAAAEIERVLADKEALLSKLREQADALETQIKKDQDRLTTALSGRRPRTALLGAERFTTREQIGARLHAWAVPCPSTPARSPSRSGAPLARPVLTHSHTFPARSQMSGASTARPSTGASQSLAPLVEGNVEQMSFERPMTGLSASLRPSTSRSERASMVAMQDRPATSAGGKMGATRMVSATMGTWVRMTQMHEFTKENRRKLQNMFVLADPHGSMKLSVEALYSVYYKAGFDVSFEEFLKILEAMGESGQDALDYADFFSHIATLTFEMPEVFEAQTSVEFAPTHIMRILSRRLTERYSVMMRQFKVEDTEGNGELTRQQLLRVIRATGLQFSVAQLDELLRNIDLLPLSTLNANKFINIFVPHHPIPSERVDLGTSLRMPNAPKQMSEAPLMSTAQLKAALQEKLRLSIDSPKEMFFQMDQTKDGTLTRHDFFRAFQRFGLFPTDKQVDELFKELDVDRKGRLDYQQFLARMAPKSHAHPHTAPPTLGTTADMDAYASAREKVRTATASGPRMQGATASQMQQAVQSKLGSLASWERALTFFRAQDVGLMGKVSKEQVLQVLRKFDIFMNVAQFDDMMVAMKLPRAGQIDYVEFLQNFAKHPAGAHAHGEHSVGGKKTVATPVCANSHKAHCRKHAGMCSALISSSLEGHCASNCDTKRPTGTQSAEPQHVAGKGREGSAIFRASDQVPSGERPGQCACFCGLRAQRVLSVVFCCQSRTAL